MPSQGFHTALSPETRRKIIEALVERYSYRELAPLIGVTPAAIYKYVAGRAIPRDDVVERALELLDASLAQEAVALIQRDLLAAVEGYLRWAARRGVLDRGFLDTLERLVARSRIILAAKSP